MSKKELLAEAKALGLKPVTRNSVAELEAMIAKATTTTMSKATRAARGDKAAKPNPDVTTLIEALGDGRFAKALEAEDLTPGSLARQLGVETAVVSKFATGKRTPRPTAPADSIAGKVAAWYAEATR